MNEILIRVLLSNASPFCDLIPRRPVQQARWFTRTPSPQEIDMRHVLRRLLISTGIPGLESTLMS